MNHTAPNPVFKIDRFTVPRTSRDVFVNRTRWIRDFLAAQDGCMRFVLLEGDAKGESASIATIAEWRDAEAMATARTAVAAQYRAADFNPQDFMAELGVTFEMDNFGLLPA